MADETKPDGEDPAEEFAAEARGRSPGLLREYLDMVVYYGKWWLVPPIVALVLMGGLLVLGGTGLAPMIYALF